MAVALRVIVDTNGGPECFDGADPASLDVCEIGHRLETYAGQIARMTAQFFGVGVGVRSSWWVGW